MRFKKKTAMLLSFALGTTMFATTAIAEIASKSGYDVLKDSVKFTAESASSKLSSYTMDLSFVVKADGNVIYSEKAQNKFDVLKQAIENNSTTINGNSNSSYYTYSDKNVSIHQNNKEQTYYLTEFTTPREDNSFKNPFEEEVAGDVERIADILVGNLKDAVIVNQKSDGSKEISGSLNESQIPALINAVVSLQSKNEFGYRNNRDSNMPAITKDVFVKEVTGKMLVNKDGLIDNLLGTGVISGKDESGKDHVLTFELTGKLYNVNSTVVAKPDLTGKKVEKNVEKDYGKLTNPTKFIGTYKTDILIEKDGKFVKIGEKFIDITAVSETSVSGKHYEKYAAGYENYAANRKDFGFNATFEKGNFYAPFTATDASNYSIKGDVYLDQHTGTVNLNIHESRSMDVMYDMQYNRVFE